MPLFPLMLLALYHSKIGLQKPDETTMSQKTNMSISQQAIISSDSAGEFAPTSPIIDIITLWPHRSLSQKGFAILLVMLGSLAIAIGLGFFLIGAWPVIGFMGLELGVLYIAFRLNYRDGKACEQLLIHASGIDIIRTTPKGAQMRETLPSLWVDAQVIKQKGRRPILQLRHHHHSYEIGAFLPPAEKKALKAEINQRISDARLNH